MDKFEFINRYVSTRERNGFPSRIAASDEAMRFWNHVERQFKTDNIMKHILGTALQVAGHAREPLTVEDLMGNNHNDDGRKEPMVLGPDQQQPGDDTRGKSENPLRNTPPTHYSPTTIMLARRILTLTLREVEMLTRELPAGFTPDELVTWAEEVVESDR